MSSALHPSLAPTPTDAGHPPRSVCVIGGGLAGIAASYALATAGYRVRLLEARPRLGGRATSYEDPRTGEEIDNCQHVSMGCCCNLRELTHQLGLADAFRTETELTFVEAGGRSSRFRASSLPAPFHLTNAFFGLRSISWWDKWRFALAVRSLARTPREQLTGRPFLDWLHEMGQSERLIQNVWEVVLVSALSESLERVDAAYAQQVFVDGFLAHREAWQVEIPQVSLDELYGRRALAALQKLGVDVQSPARVEKVERVADRWRIAIQSAQPIDAEQVILATPWHQAARLLPDSFELTLLRDQLAMFSAAPITSVHLWTDRPLTNLPHAVLLGGICQWLFFRGEVEREGGLQCLSQVVISASRSLSTMRAEEIVAETWADLLQHFPQADGVRLLNSRVITEKRAVFSAVPGVDEFRPAQSTPLAGLHLAGDWTASGWPATMEGAVRSGFLAAESVCREAGAPKHFVVPNLKPARLTRLLLRNPES